jgi:hypothetical protein
MLAEKVARSKQFGKIASCESGSGSGRSLLECLLSGQDCERDYYWSSG